MIYALFAAQAPDFDPNQVTPGVIGFVAIALIAMAALLLGVDLNRRVRRTRYRAEAQERIQQELRDEAAAKAAPGSDAQER